MGDSQYSFSLTTFSPSGKLVQIEHALTAVGSGQTSLGIKAANGVVIATEKKLPSILVDETSVQKIQFLTPNIGVVYSGMGPDFRVLVRKSRKQAEQYHRLYKEPIPVTQLVRETAAVMQEFTQSGGVRPFGVSLLVAGYDDNGPQLYQVDPSGSYFSWKASAMGKNVSNAKTFLEKRYTDDMELDDAVHTAILTLKEGFEGQISGKNIEIGIIGIDKKFRQVPASSLQLFPPSYQILDFIQEEVDADRVWGSLDDLPPTHATWDDLVNVAVQLRLNKNWDPSRINPGNFGDSSHFYKTVAKLDSSWPWPWRCFSSTQCLRHHNLLPPISSSASSPFAAPRVGSIRFKEKLNELRVKALRMLIKQDIVLKSPEFILGSQHRFQQIHSYHRKTNGFTGASYN
ncbi:Proteasome subunit alpha type-2 [Hibiscus syriacus]|uniref:Proteasome subunit alpha type-2 n=1 Tax=Hibiscus syriacus TaxID=106335 RepID=A0A6A3ATG1_HIBSY|nr:Proteasome subunit alpha type-2 [Hibiscus syriacus]